MKKTARTIARTLLGLLAVLAIAWAAYYWFARKPIRQEIKASYSVADADFRRSINGLLGAPFTEGNRVQTLINGDEIFSSMLESIRSAQKTITLETYIWSQGKVCDEFRDALREKSKAGVKVHIVVDGMGSFRLKQKDIDLLQEAGVRIYKFNRSQWYKVNFQINHRTHRKILIVDGKTGFIGGSCLHDSWLGNAETEHQWRDTHFKIEGPSVAQLQGIFADNWRQTTGEVLQGPDYFPELKTTGSLPVQFYMCGPKDNQESIRLAFLLALSSAQKNIRIAHAYFLPDDLFVKTLQSARARGVEIEIIVPDKIDSKITKAAARKSWKKLMESGAKFYQYGPAMYHVKEIIIDDVLVIAGSANFDNRSFRINDEANFNVLDREFAARQITVFEKDKAQSRHLKLSDLENRSLFSKTTDRFAGFLSSQF